MKVLILYNESQTYTETVFEHLDAFRKFSKNKFRYLHYENLVKEKNSLKYFESIILHYSVRLPMDQVSEGMADILSEFKGSKCLFIQDEYDNVSRTKYWIKRINFNLVFTVVPRNSIEIVYPKNEFPNVNFVNNLTGYAPENLKSLFEKKILPPSRRNINIGYRGRRLPIRYGDLARDKFKIGISVKRYCQLNNVAHDIEWDEQCRIYGNKWYEFIANCKAMLGTESGSNIFDWDGCLNEDIKKFHESSPSISDEELYDNYIKPLERPGLMNQISPRIFEMAAAGTIMVLYEGEYSNVIYPNRHFLPLKKDLSNLPQIIALLRDDDFIDEMSVRVKKEIIDFGGYGYQQFVEMVDQELSLNTFKPINYLIGTLLPLGDRFLAAPIKAPAIFTASNDSRLKRKFFAFALRVWPYLPPWVRKIIKGINRKSFFYLDFYSWLRNNLYSSAVKIWPYLPLWVRKLVKKILCRS